MSGICHKLAEWMRSPFSAVVYFQKHFVDDVTDTVKRQKEQFDRHAREMQERAVQLHLDELEGKYLCCVCGRPGESREDDEFVYDTFSIVTLPPKRTIEKGIHRAHELEEEEAEKEDAEDTRKMQQLRQRRREREHQRERHRQRHRDRHRAAEGNTSRQSSKQPSATSRRKTALSSRSVSAYYDDDDDDVTESRNRDRGNDGDSGSDWGDDADRRVSRASSSVSDSTLQGTSNSTSRRPTRSNTAVDFYSASGPDAAGGSSNAAGDTNEAPDFPALDPDLVPPLEVRNLMYKIRHAVLNREARTKRKAVHVHRDKGLTKIEESEIDMYSSFFQRPVHGFLCRECYTSARKRLDTVTEQIQTILFKAKHPFLRKVSDKEVNVLAAAGQLSAGLVASILDIQRTWTQQQEASAMRASRLRLRREAAQRQGVPEAALTSGPVEDDDDGDKVGSGAEAAALLTGHGPAAQRTTTLADATVTSLRSTVRCAVCQRRQSCFFNRVNVLFLCQFCTARDRFYRERAVCINDEPMPMETVHLLTELARFHEGVHRAQELRQLPQTELDTAPTNLFNQEENLFKIQSIAPELLPASAAVPPHAAPTFTSEPPRDEQLVKREQLSQQAAGYEAGEGDSRDALIQIKVEPRPYVDVRDRRRRELDPRAIVGATQLSLFEDTRVEPVAAMDLFAGKESGATAPRSGGSTALNDLFVPTAVKPPGETTVEALFASQTAPRDPSPAVMTSTQHPQLELTASHFGPTADLSGHPTVTGYSTGFATGTPHQSPHQLSPGGSSYPISDHGLSHGALSGFDGAAPSVGTGFAGRGAAWEAAAAPSPPSATGKTGDEGKAYETENTRTSGRSEWL